MAKARTIKKAGIEAKRKKMIDIAMGDPKDYTPDAVFEEGDVIRHKIWDDIGEVVEVGTTEDGIQKMIVHFKDKGIKILKMG